MRTAPPSKGEHFGRWEVIGEPFMQSPGHRAVRCRCQCGTEADVLIFALRNRKSSSCGCWRRERTATIASETRWKNSHGLSKHPLYQTWKRIIRRCYSPTSTQYRWYGAIGVQVWEGWRHDPAAFIQYVEQELGPRPSLKHSIDRFPPDANYEPGKIRWADPLTQARNQRSRKPTA